MIRVTQIKLRPDEVEKSLRREIRHVLHLRETDKFTFTILRQAVDARKKPQIFYVYTVAVSLEDRMLEQKILRKNRSGSVSDYQEVPYRIPGSLPPADGGAAQDREDDLSSLRPVIVGAGPAGLFCALSLARAGRRPVVIERGDPMDVRRAKVEAFWEGGMLDPESNVQFGEGGAGTFSDGKLNTGVKDSFGRIRFVLDTFAEAGADPDILYSYKPHIGTDVLSEVITRIRDEIIARGGFFLFGTCLKDMKKNPDGTYVLTLSGAGNDTPGEGRERTLTAKTVVLAIGHSSRDTFAMLRRENFRMSPKAFAVGLRIQHPQSMISDALYGAGCPYDMPPAPYKLTHRLKDGRGVYSFCMCPGGYVVNASSEPGRLAVNGMSYHGRSSENANSAIVVTVSPEDIRGYLDSPWGAGASGGEADMNFSGADDLFAGLRFQRVLERYAFMAGGGGTPSSGTEGDAAAAISRAAVPLQRFEDYRLRRPSEKAGAVRPVMKGRYVFSDVRSILPDPIAEAIEEGVLSFDRQIEGFSCPDALLAGVESRTSSPIRIERGADLQSLSCPGIYPCGEGAGYAGGITSAAVDGLKTAEAILAAD